MTSNIGSSVIQDSFEKMTDMNHDEVLEKTKTQVFELLKQTIRPEFLNRIDELVMFAPLNITQIEEIVSLQMAMLQKTLIQNGVQLEVTKSALNLIASLGFDPQFGARPVKRAIQKYVLNDLSKQLISGKVHSDQTIVVDADNNGLVFNEKQIDI